MKALRSALVVLALCAGLAAGPLFAEEDWVWVAANLLYRSPDGVSGWTPVPAPANILNFLEIEIDPHAPHDAFLATGNGIFRHSEGD